MSKNPHKPGSPLWQLFENATSKRNTANAFAADAERYTRMSQDARAESEEYQNAYEVLLTAKGITHE